MGSWEVFIDFLEILDNLEKCMFGDFLGFRFGRFLQFGNCQQFGRFFQFGIGI